MPPAVLEALESRRLFAINLVAGVLVVTGTTGDDVITVYKDNGSSNVLVDMNGSTFGPYTPTQISANKVKVVGDAGNDQINLWQSGGGFDLQYPGEVYGDDGDDLILATNLSNFADSLFGGYGHDTIEAFGGADSVFGGYGDDSIDGGNENDFLHGEDGNDTIIGGLGSDQMYGDDGNDSFRALDNAIDTVNGGPGTDCVGTDKNTVAPTIDVLQFMEG